MIKSLFKLTTVLFTAVSAFVFADCQTTFEVGLGYRRDYINARNIERNVDDSHSFRSHHKFKDLDIVLLSAKLRSWDSCYYFRAAGDYGWITDGRVSRGHCFGDISSASSSSNGGHRHRSINGSDNFVADATIAIGYPFFMGCCCEFMVAPVIGYAWDTQHIKTKRDHFFNNDASSSFDVSRRASSSSSSSSSFSSSSSSSSSSGSHRGHNKYRFTWYAPYVGVDLSYMLDDCWSIYGEFEYHFVVRTQEKRSNWLNGLFASDVSGSNQWHGRNKTLKNGNGFVGTVGGYYFWGCDWYAGLSTSLYYFNTSRSHHHHNSSSSGSGSGSSCFGVGTNVNGTSENVSNNHHHKNKITWKSWNLMAQIGYVF